MSGQNTSFREAVKSIPQVYFDFIARLVPGILTIASIWAAHYGPEEFWEKLQSWVSELKVSSYAIFSVLMLLSSYVLATFIWCAWSWLMKVIPLIENWDDEEFRWHYENIKYKNPAAGDRITKLKAQVHMAEILVVGFVFSFLLSLDNLPDVLPSLFFTVLLLLLVVFSWNARSYFIRHMKTSLDNNLKILISQKAGHSERLVLLFDFDGTLIDLDKLEAYKGVVKSKRKSNLATRLYKADNELCAKGEYDRRKVFEQFPTELGDDTEQLCRVFWDEVTRTQKIKPCCLSTLNILKNEGHVLACVTDSDGFGGNKLKRIEATGLNRYFAKIFIGGDNGKPRKGTAEYMGWVVKELGLYLHRWVMVGDKTEIDLKPAEAEGMKTVLVKNEEYSGNWPLEIESLHELLPIILSLKTDGIFLK